MTTPTAASESASGTRARRLTTVGVIAIGFVLASATAISAQANPPAQTAPQRTIMSWTQDRRGFELGDVLTVFVDERTLASARADEYARDDRRFGRTAGIMGSRYGAILDGDASSDQRGTARRDERFITEISVRVVEQGPGGLVRVEGTKQLKVDEHQQSVVLRGWVRAQDVSGTNVVEAWRVGDLELLYESNGELVKPQTGLLQRLLGIIF